MATPAPAVDTATLCKTLHRVLGIDIQPHALAAGLRIHMSALYKARRHHECQLLVDLYDKLGIKQNDFVQRMKGLLIKWHPIAQPDLVQQLVTDPASVKVLPPLPARPSPTKTTSVKPAVKKPSAAALAETIKKASDFHYHAIANGKALTVTTVSYSQTAHVERAALLRFKFLDAQGQELPPTHQLDLHPTLGNFAYLNNGTKTAPARTELNFSLPEGAKQLGIAFVRSRQDVQTELLQAIDVKETESVQTTTGSAFHRISSDHAPQPQDAVTHKLVYFEKKTCVTFDNTAASDEVTYTVSPHHTYELSTTVYRQLNQTSKPALLAIKILDGNGQSLSIHAKGVSSSARFGSYAYIEGGKNKLAITMPEAAASLHVKVVPWHADDFCVGLPQDIKLISIPKEAIDQKIRKAIDRVLAQAKKSQQLVIVYTGTKRIGEANRANRSMMFARLLESMQIPTIYTYAISPGETRFDADSDFLVQVPLEQFAKHSTTIIADADVENKILIGSLPDAELCRLIGLAKYMGWKTVYECRDDWEEFAAVGSTKWYEDNFEQFAVSHCTKTFCVSPALQRKMQLFTDEPEKVLLSPNGTTIDFVNHSKIYRTRRQKEGTPQPPIIGYFGHLTDHWFDWQALCQTAQHLPDIRFEVIGFDFADRDVPANMHYLGSKTHEEIIAIANRWAIGLIPFKSGRLARSVDPIKIYEYLSLGLITVTTPMGAVNTYPLTFTYNDGGLTNAIKRALAYMPTAQDWKQVEQLLAGATWRHRLIHLLEKSGFEWQSARKRSLPSTKTKKRQAQ